MPSGRICFSLAASQPSVASTSMPAGIFRTRALAPLSRETPMNPSWRSSIASHGTSSSISRGRWRPASHRSLPASRPAVTLSTSIEFDGQVVGFSGKTTTTGKPCSICRRRWSSSTRRGVRTMAPNTPPSRIPRARLRRCLGVGRVLRGQHRVEPQEPRGLQRTGKELAFKRLMVPGDRVRNARPAEDEPEERRMRAPAGSRP